MTFVHTAFPARVVFGPGSLRQVAAETDLLGVRRALVIATGSARQAADQAQADLKELFAGRIDGVRQHVPTEVAAAARAKARETNADGIIAIGGGSAVGLAKAIALAGDVRIIAVPTTYAGSEMTPVWGETADGSKTTGTDLRVLPRTVLYDPELTIGLPIETTAASVANALAHCVEAVWTDKANPITETTAVEATRALSEGLRATLQKPQDIDARSNLLYGACLAGSALAQAGTGVHHKLCHLLGGSYNLPHAETHAAVLPQVARVQAPSVPKAKARLEAALQTDDLATGLFDLFRQANIPTSLRQLGLTEEQAEAAAAKFPQDVDEILTRAWTGTRPEGAAR
ncbi:maleylacetate reductase [Kribbella sandramycini]|uniref:Maleylacetate reductase n=1 Tax=Kribbella sandramycini TaxID=60450 RepID=A0A7Y4L0T4_9ACTN|nr:maleylacetate reductase [Kribbella sandramycini]MBB6565188.1 maleylacetate reductase [Kribbella sandramycini]NOL41457.1 maleylacetate reductase [Kribbella sandramycini]